MGVIVFKQPNGKYARWSGVMNAFTFWNATKQEYIEYKIKELKEQLEEDFEKGEFQKYDLNYILKYEGYFLIRRALLEGDFEKDIIKTLRDMGATEEQVNDMYTLKKRVESDLKKEIEEK